MNQNKNKHAKREDNKFFKKFETSSPLFYPTKSFGWANLLSFINDNLLIQLTSNYKDSFATSHQVPRKLALLIPDEPPTSLPSHQVSKILTTISENFRSNYHLS